MTTDERLKLIEKELRYIKNLLLETREKENHSTWISKERWKADQIKRNRRA